MAKVKEESAGGPNVNAAVLAFFKKNSDSILNLQDEADEYKISTGSLNLDYALSGGYGAGFHRLCGITEGGKTSSAFLAMQNFFRQFPTGRGIYVKTERLGPDIRKRLGVKLVKHPDEWVDGSCLIIETNVFEMAADAIQSILLTDKSRKYCVILDSMDGLILKDDVSKGFGEATKVSGGAVLTKFLMKRISIYIEKYGHLVFPISQKTADIQISQYAPADPKMGSFGGGNALAHFSNNIIEFVHRYKGDDILANPSEKPDMLSNPIVGHWVKVWVRKSTAESSHVSVKYPVKHGRIGNAVWIELEITEFLLNFGLIEKGGAWYNFSEELVAELKSKGLEPSETKFQGESKLHAFFEKNPAIVEELRKYCLKTLESQ